MAGLLTGNKTASAAVRGDDFYGSPYAALPPLLVAEGKRLPRTIWEPAAGNGALVLPLRNRGYHVHATDLNNWGCPGSEAQVDFTGEVAVRHGDRLRADHGDKFGIVTNPPFNIIETFVERAVAMSPYVALLCRLAFLESEGRMLWFPRVGLRRVHVIGERLPMMHRHGYDGPKLSNAGMCFAWFIFEIGKRPVHQVPVRWVSWKKACRKFPQTDADTPPVAKDQLGLFEVAA
ncbi:hypothetical protein FJ959_22215 [Mesorhizobium sp. B2-2-4]|uniref:hypothetical protein n=1 Tax=unclassified Mesorhizobium TaxID=325217 RepID=UPI00112CFC3C|nr:MULTISPECIES: hypothetical protein [unclassified Mesorhizobium]TPM53249.1 hypothetical protein FJ959_22215 [Mesorhizobium sp. B2-2-4]TPM62109.1 hypothetical protein FJ965_21155 [Mesorhizobium sp. B2-2-1]TPN68480.1 hypothetical protein FJ984_11635 [Mesorhizobium sp. B1-1-3]